ncbi:MAG: hypothetical protein AB7T15_07805 [Desulfuromonas sp.]|jgi:translation initiation factor eIF-2B subunit delta|nr:hypothetical protein [Desulfuromonas thiophila]MDY0399028.1 hypothetical protein [Desulfuromonas thiophila]
MDEAAFSQALAVLRADRRHGASELARQALALLAASCQSLAALDDDRLRAELKRRCCLLAGCRPSMAVVANLLQLWCQRLDQPAAAAGKLADWLAAQAQAVAAASLAASQAAARHMAQRLRPGQCLITHSASSTLRLLFAELAPARLRLIVSESRPLNEGVGLAAELLRLGHEVRLITDAQLGLFVAEADLALVGADSLLADGSIVNKAGTRLLALAARADDVPFYCCCEGFKVTARTRADLAREQMDPAELGHDCLPLTAQRNLYFDCTEASLVSAWVTEAGVSARPPAPLTGG